ncbi:MAG: pseudaminic acid synthase [Pseudomonadota bacterium]
MMEFEIGEREIGEGHEPYIVAELSANHNGSIEKACEIIVAMADAGAHAVKLQTYTADTMTLDHTGEDFMLQSGPWAGHNLYSLYQWAHTPWEWHEKLFETAKAAGLAAFSTPFDTTAVDFLEQFDPPAYKVASFEIVDIPLIEYVASKGRPMIMSTGMASEEEIDQAVSAAREGGCEDLILLHCTSGYPTPPEESDLLTIPHLAQRHQTLVGLSDHTMASEVALSAIALGACVVEKHVTMKREDGGPDADFSLEPKELAALVASTKVAWQAMGSVRRSLRDAEKTQQPLRRSLYVVKDMEIGEVFGPENVRSIRPGYGLAPKHLNEIFGQVAKQRIARGTPLRWELVGER